MADIENIKIRKEESEFPKHFIIYLGSAFLMGLMTPVFVTWIWILTMSPQQHKESVAQQRQDSGGTLQENEGASGAIYAEGGEGYIWQAPEEGTEYIWQTLGAPRVPQSMLITSEIEGIGSQMREEFRAFLEQNPSCEAFSYKYILPDGTLGEGPVEGAEGAYSLPPYIADPEECFTMTDGENVLIGSIGLNQAYEGTTTLGGVVIWIDKQGNVYEFYHRLAKEFQDELIDILQAKHNADFASPSWAAFDAEYTQAITEYFENSEDIEKERKMLRDRMRQALQIDIQD